MYTAPSLSSQLANAVKTGSRGMMLMLPNISVLVLNDAPNIQNSGYIMRYPRKTSKI